MKKPKYDWPAELTQEELSFLERIVSNAYHRAMRKLRLPNAKVTRSRGRKRGPRSRTGTEATASP